MKNAGVVGATMAWVASSGGVDASMASMVVASMASMASNGGFDGVVGGLVAWWRRWRRWLASMVDWGLRHRGH